MGADHGGTAWRQRAPCTCGLQKADPALRQAVVVAVAVGGGKSRLEGQCRGWARTPGWPPLRALTI